MGRHAHTDYCLANKISEGKMTQVLLHVAATAQSCWLAGLEPRQKPGTPSAWLLCAFCFVSRVPPAQVILRPGSGLLLSSRTSYIHKLCAYQGSLKYSYSAKVPGSVWMFQNWKWLSVLQMRPAMTTALLHDFLCMVQLCVSLWAG